MFTRDLQPLKPAKEGPPLLEFLPVDNIHVMIDPHAFAQHEAGRLQKAIDEDVGVILSSGNPNALHEAVEATVMHLRPYLANRYRVFLGQTVDHRGQPVPYIGIQDVFQGGLIPLRSFLSDIGKGVVRAGG